MTSKELPITFSAEMVRAILDGRKTQTRRPINPDHIRDTEHGLMFRMPRGGWSLGGYESPYGKPGDMLWVQEEFKIDDGAKGTIDGGTSYDDDGVYYQGSDLCRSFEHYKHGFTGEFPVADELIRDLAGEWQNPKDMPRWASRINLENTKVWVERVRDIGIYDVEAEGLDVASLVSGYEIESEMGPGDRPEDFWEAARGQFEKYWNSIYKTKGQGWATNPWVGVIEFKRIK